MLLRSYGFRTRAIIFAAFALAAHWATSVWADGLLYTGVSLAGAEFGPAPTMSNVGVYNTDYTYPTSAEVNYYVGKGMNTFRLPFRWERLQHTQNAVLDATELGRMDSFVNYATANGAYVLLDPHNYERYYPDTGGSYDPVIGGSSVPDSSFANFWSQVAAHFKNNGHVIFDLMNEPHDLPTEQIVATDNAAIAAIRAAGAHNMIFVEGNGYSSSWGWTQSGPYTANSAAMLNIVDPGNNYAFEMHMYLDSDNSGSHDTINNNDSTTGMQRLTAATQWLQANHLRGFLGEFAVPNVSIGSGTYVSASDGQTHPQIGDETLNNMLTYIKNNTNTWMGWTWWGGGPWWGDYMFALDPTNLGMPGQTDRPAMSVLQPYFATRVGDFNNDGHINAADISAEIMALTNRQGYETNYGVDESQLQVIGDLNDDGIFTNADLQAFINFLKSGGGSSDTVPEPATFVLVGIGFLSVLTCVRQRRRFRCDSRRA
jgi:endoglucanase